MADNDKIHSNAASPGIREKLALRRRLGRAEWERIITVLPGGMPTRRKNAELIRCFVEAVLWVADTGAGWKNMPPEYGPWGSQYMRFIRWSRNGLWGKIIPLLESGELQSALSLGVNDCLAERNFRTSVKRREGASLDDACGGNACGRISPVDGNNDAFDGRYLTGGQPLAAEEKTK